MMGDMIGERWVSAKLHSWKSSFAEPEGGNESQQDQQELCVQDFSRIGSSIISAL